MTNISQDIVIADSEVYTKPFDKGSVREGLTKRIAWDDTDFELVGAKLIVTADQPANSGADLRISLNQRAVDVIRWEAFDTDEKTERYDVMDKLFNGVNDFTLVYSAVNHVLQQADVQVTIVLNLVFRKIDLSSDDDTPATGGATRDSQFFDKVLDGLQAHGRTLLIVSVAIGTLVTVVKFWDKIFGTGRFGRIANLFRK